MKHTKFLAILTAAALLLPLTGCGSEDPLYYRYDYDLSDYITLAEYKNLPVADGDYTVTDEDVQNEIMSTILYFAQETEVDRASREGDAVKFSCTATLDGAELADYCEEAGSITLGFNAYGEDVEKALTGVKAGDTVKAERKMDGVLVDEELAGKTIQYTFSITSVCETEQPVYNDVFVKAYLGFDTAAEYEATVREVLEEAAADNRLLALVNQTWPVVVENTQVIQYPEKEIKQVASQLTADLEAYTAGVGINFGEYTELVYGMSEEEFRAQAEEMAQAQVKEDMIVYAIARAENLEISEEVYHEYVHLFMEQMNLSSEEELERRYTVGAIKEGILGDLVKECIVGYTVDAE